MTATTTPSQRLTEDMKNALRAHDALRLDAVRFLLAQVRNAEIDTPDRRPLTEDEFVKLVQKLVKNAHEAIEQYQSGDRTDLVAEEQKKVAIWESYLPQQLADDELMAIVERVVAANPGQAFGPLIGLIMKEVTGRADGSRVSGLLKVVAQKQA